MGESKKIITEDNFREWLASTGNLFPGNKSELNRFEKLYSDFEYRLDESYVDPFAIINGDFIPKRIKIELQNSDNDGFKMAARNLEHLPEHILSKLKKNQDGLHSKKKGSSEQ
ncbi:MAG TPA: hypothetical protein DHV28_17210 [Ignavibacteriales bacterium]|nr:hypothetical protein [Ignavibacteriales bacterium]